MKINRRVFFHVLGGTSFMVLLPFHSVSMANINTGKTTKQQIEKSIKASFGGGFKTYEYIQNKRLNYATIGHAGKRYLVASKDLYDWQIISTKI